MRNCDGGFRGSVEILNNRMWRCVLPQLRRGYRQRFSTEEAVSQRKEEIGFQKSHLGQDADYGRNGEPDGQCAVADELGRQQDSSFRQAIKTGPPLPGDKEVMHTQTDSQM